MKIKDKEVILDEEDYQYFSQWKWSINNSGYVRRTLKQKASVDKCIYLHRAILNTPNNMQTDHINGNKLDNRKCNLRIATISQNNANKNKSARSTTSKYKYVSWYTRQNRWIAEVKGKYVGSFMNEVEAAKAGDKKALELFGEFAKLNFPKEK